MSTHETSIIIPFYNEEESVRFVLEEVLACQPDAEIIAVDDGSRDRTWEIICSLPAVHGLRLTENRGQSAAMYAGLRAASGGFVVLMDGDGQNDPTDINDLVQRLHRYLPAIFKQAGLCIVEMPVNHRARAQGISKYTNWERALRGIYDLFAVRWLLKRKIVYPEIETRGSLSG